MKEYQKSGKIHPCRLEKADLSQLVEIIKKTFPISNRKEDFELSTNLPTITVRENSLEDFLKHEELPDKINRLSIRIIGWDENREIDRNIRITFYDNFILLDVAGFDQTWVIGKYSLITDFLKKKKPWFWALNIAFPYIAFLIPLLCGAALVYLIRANKIIYAVSTTIFMIASIYANILYNKGTFLPHTQIVLSPKISIFSKENIMIIIAIFTLIFTIIGAVIVPLIK